MRRFFVYMETIVALATAPMKSALHIIRVSGDDAFDIVSKISSKVMASSLVNYTIPTI